MDETDTLVLTKLENYRKPVKTKHLSPRVNLDRNELTRRLNALKKIGLVDYVIHIRDETPVYGWVKVKPDESD